MTTVTRKIVTVSVSAATIVWLSGAAMLAPVAVAQTSAEVQAQIDALLAQIVALQAQLAARVGGDACYPYARDLTLGVRGDDVSAVQTYLVAQNKGARAQALASVFAAGTAKGYFGPLTQAALAEYQASVGISPAAGYFGPITRAHLQAACVSQPPAEEEEKKDGELKGGAGAVDQYDLVSGLQNEEVGEDEEDVEVAGLEIEVSDSSDLEFTAVTLDFDQNNADNDDFDEYADEVSVWLDGEEVGRVDASRFDEDTGWRRTITLDRGAIIRAGDTGELIVAISGVRNLDSNDEGETWDVDFDLVRYRDATGASTSEDPGTAVRTFSFETFATASDLELRVRLNEDDEDINDAHVIDIDDANDTDDVEFLSFTMEARGRSDITIDEIPVVITTTEAAGANFDDPDDVITSVSLWRNGRRVATENLSAADANDDTETVTFDDLDLELDAGDIDEFMVKLDLVSTGDALDNGDTIQVQMTAVEVDAIDAEDESGEELVAADLTGTALADAHVVYDAGIIVEFVSATATRSFTADEAGESDTGEYKITFRVTAFDGDMRIDRTCEDDNGADADGQGTVFDFTVSAGDEVGWTVGCLLSSSSADSEDTANTFEVDENKTRTFTLTVNVTPDEDSFVEVAIESINWGTNQDNTNAEDYTFSLDEFKTDSIFLNDIP